MDDEHRVRLETLKAMVLGERRVLSDEAIAPDPARVAAGWERRFVADAKRAAETAVLYESLGFEVAADPVKIETLDPDCADCQLVMLLDFKVIYTRRREGGT